MDINGYSEIVFKASDIIARELDALLDQIVADNDFKNFPSGL